MVRKQLVRLRSCTLGLRFSGPKSSGVKVAVVRVPDAAGTWDPRREHGRRPGSRLGRTMTTTSDERWQWAETGKTVQASPVFASVAHSATGLRTCLEAGSTTKQVCVPMPTARDRKYRRSRT